MKVFISQPMNGKTQDEIISTRIDIINRVLNKYKDSNITFTHSFLEFVPKKNSSLFFLARSLELLSDADLAVFGGDWKNYRGCRIERICCEEYDIPIDDDI